MHGGTTSFHGPRLRPAWQPQSSPGATCTEHYSWANAVGNPEKHCSATAVPYLHVCALDSCAQSLTGRHPLAYSCHSHFKQCRGRL